MSASGVALDAPAKVNLALHVTGRRADGYHLLDSIAVFVDVGERVAVAEADRLTLEIAGRFSAHAPGDGRDLCWRAAEAFFADAGLPPRAAIRVEKAIPAGAGLGGGSSDAAAVLLALDRCFRTRFPQERLSRIGLTLGADVPMCLAGRTLRARGIGEAIDTLADWPRLALVLVWPGTGVPTAEVFRSLARRDNPPLPDPPAFRDAGALAAWLADCRNDLEAPARALAPEIGAVLDALRASGGCLLARMSGSGSACFGLYPGRRAAERAAAALAEARPGWWCVAGETR